MNLYTYPIAAAIAFLSLYIKVRQLLRDPKNPGLRNVCGLLATLGTALVVGWYPVYLGIDALTGQPNLARYLQHAFALVASTFIQVFFLYLEDEERAPRRAVRRWILLALAVLATGIAFVMGDFAVEAPNDFATRYAGDPHLNRYMIVYLASLALAISDIMRLSLRHTKQAPPSLLRLGMQMLVAGSAVGLLYVVNKTLFLLGLDLPWGEGRASELLTLLGVALVGGGLVIQGVGSFAVRARAWRRQYRLYAALYPLWLAIARAVSDGDLQRPPRLPALRTMDVALRGRVIQIRDGLRLLSPYCDPAIADEAARTAAGGQDVNRAARAVGQATAIAVMLDSLRSTPARQPLNREGNSYVTDAGEDLEDDATRLAEVAAALTSSPVVADFRSRQHDTSG